MLFWKILSKIVFEKARKKALDLYSLIVVLPSAFESFYQVHKSHDQMCMA